MEPNKNIDRLFQEKFRDFEETPPDIVWDTIEATLDGKKKRRIIPIWWRYAGVAVVLLLLSFSTFKYLKDKNNRVEIENTIVDVDANTTPLINENNLPNSKTNDNVIVSTLDDKVNKKQATVSSEKEKNTTKQSFEKENINTNKSIVIVENKGENNPKKPLTQLEKTQDLTPNSEQNKTSTNKLIAQNTSDESAHNTHSNFKNNTVLERNEIKNPSKTEETTPKTEEIAYKNIENLEDTLDDKYKLKEEQLDDKLRNRWSVATVVAPVFYNSFSSKGSPLDLDLNNSPKEGSQSVAYGIKVGFKLNKKWSIQSGVSMMNVGYSVGDIYINPSPQFTSRLANVDYISTGTILNVSTSNIIDSNQIETSATKPIKGSLNQEYGYIEVPLEMKYSLTNGRLGVSLIGGFSTLFLNSNIVSVETPQFSSELGEARNLNEVDFSGNFGFDIDYNLNKNLYINVSPMLKVYTNTFSDNYENSDNFKPYLFGVYTGLNYRF